MSCRPRKSRGRSRVIRRCGRPHVTKLRDVAMESVAAIDKKSPDDLVEAGDHLDKACEACHLVYWYPNDKTPQ